jgi:signal transduction histidine kinase
VVRTVACPIPENDRAPLRGAPGQLQLLFVDQLGPQAMAQTLPPARHRTTVSQVNALGAGAPGGGVGRDQPDQARLGQLAEEQAALRRVATLVARGVPPEEVFAAVTEEVERLFPVGHAAMYRYEPDSTLTFVANSGEGMHLPVGSRWRIGGHNLGALVFQTGRPARIDSYADATGLGAASARKSGIRWSVGVPVTVEGRLWGLVSIGSFLEQPLPADTEARLASFTDLVATAVANAQSRAALAQLAEEQASLRRVATLVARGPAPQEVFAAVAEEVGRLLAVDFTILVRYDPQGTLEVAGTWTRTGASAPTPVGGRLPLGGRNVTTMVYQTGQAARIDYSDHVSGVIGQVASRDWGLRSSVGVPVSAESRVWGCMVVAFSGQELRPLPADTDARLASFTELVATAIANTESRSELAASRRRIVAASDEARRRIERDLHDGTQQRLVSLGLAVRAAEANAPADRGDLRAELSRIAGGLADAVTELQEFSRGIHPAILSERGLGPALRTLARRSAVPVDLDVTTNARYPEPIEIAAYYVASEALANAMKHARASIVHIELDTPDTALRLAIRDDGIGGADPARGSGLTGLRDRIEAVGGTFDVTSPAKGGTTLLIEIPV